MKLLDEMFCIERAEGQQVELRLNAAHPIYGAHFPDMPITPGVCIVQMLGELLALQTGWQLTLAKISNLKFIHTLSPLECPRLTVTFDSVTIINDSVRAKGTINTATVVATKFSLTFVKS